MAPLPFGTMMDWQCLRTIGQNGSGWLLALAAGGTLTALLGCDDSGTNLTFANPAAVGGSTGNAQGGASATPTGAIGGVVVSAGPLRVLPATLTPAPSGQCKFPAGYDGNGSLTWYLFSQGSTAVNCSYLITGSNPDTVKYVSAGAGQYFAALNTPDYAGAAMCGACVEVTRDGSRTVSATIVDQCPSGSNPKCKAGHLDLSKAAFLQIGSESEGYLGTGNGGVIGTVSWKYVSCPTQGNIVVRLKEPANKYWNEFLVENHANPVARFEMLLGTQWASGTRQTYNYWSVNGGNVGLPKQVRITDIHGAVIETTLEYPTDGGAAVELSAQFPACTG